MIRATLLALAISATGCEFAGRISSALIAVPSEQYIPTIAEEDHRDYRPRVVNISPYELARSINDNETRFANGAAMKDTDLAPVWAEIGVSPSNFDQADGDLHATVTSADFDRDQVKEVVLKVTSSFYCRYVVFSRRPQASSVEQPRWTVIGVIDHEFNRYEMSTHRVLSSGGRRFLVVRGQTGSGTGFACYEDAWYAMDEEGLRRVLSYSAAGLVAPHPCGLGRELSSTVRPVRSRQRIPAFDVVLRLKFSTLDYMNDRYTRVASVARSIRFTWDEGLHRFQFDRRASQVSESELTNVFDPEECCDDEATRSFLARYWGLRGSGNIRRLERFDHDCNEGILQMEARRKRVR